ncbi:MAG: hypothetical protein ABI600_00750 [Luteolibacter sp.]
MAEVIQFNCPVCGTTLRLPLDLAAQKGPCPTCQHEIIAPDPYRGIGALEAPSPVVLRANEPFRPFADSPPLTPKMPEPVASPTASAPAGEIATPEVPNVDLPAPPTPPVGAAPSPTVLVLSCLLSFAVALAMGYALGIRSDQYFMRIPRSAPLEIPVEKPKKTTAAEEAVPAPRPEPTPIFVKPIIQQPTKELPKTEAHEVDPIEEPIKVSAAAEASLRAFLEAPDWAARNAHVLYPESVRPAMEAYSQQAPDGPTPFKSISVKQSQTDEKSGNTLFVFQVDTESIPTGIPVAVVETPKGWLTDWQTFVEFRDDHFKHFADGPAKKTQRFHLIVSTPPPARAAKTENETFASFLLDPPMPGRQQLAFVKKDSEAYQICQAATASGGIFTPVLDVTKLTTPDGQGYLEILNVSATDWLPKEK